MKQGAVDHLTGTEKNKIIESFISNKKVLSAVYDAMF